LLEDDMEPIRARRSASRLAITLGVVGLFVAACGSGNPTAADRSAMPGSPAVTASANPVAAIIPVGRYTGPVQQVADIVVRLEQDSSLSDSDRAAILDDVLEIRNAATYQVTLDVRDGNRFDLIMTIDGKLDSGGVEHWTMWPVDDRLFVVKTDCCGMQVYGVERQDHAVRLSAKSPASSNVERFVRSVVFETGTFARAD
jgi:hypothetical protein